MERSGLHGALLLKDFYIRRIFRIYPLSILAVAAALALHLDSGKMCCGRCPSRCRCIYSSFLFAWVRRKRVFWSILALWIVSLLAAWAQPQVPALDRASLLRFVPCFLPRVVAFAMPRIPSLSSYLWPIFILGLVAAFTINPVLPMGWALCLVLGLLIPFFREIQTKSIRTITNRVATYSYGIYISRQFCIWLALGVLAARPVWLSLGVLSTSLVVLPILLYHGIEKPMIQLGIRLAARWGEKAAAARAVAA